LKYTSCVLCSFCIKVHQPHRKDQIIQTEIHKKNRTILIDYQEIKKSYKNVRKDLNLEIVMTDQIKTGQNFQKDMIEPIKIDHYITSNYMKKQEIPFKIDDNLTTVPG
jgi:hypothetical protein